MSIGTIFLVLSVAIISCSGQLTILPDFLSFKAFGHEVNVDTSIIRTPDRLRASIGAHASTANNGPHAGARFGGFVDKMGVGGGVEAEAVKDDNNLAIANLGAKIFGSDIVTSIFTFTKGTRR